MKVLMVCLGNICRSPLAEGIFCHLSKQYGLTAQFDSAGTADYHVGDLPDHRSRKVAQNHGFELTHRGRQFVVEDFDRFDEILVMDESNYKNVIKLARHDQDKRKVKIITHYDIRENKPPIVVDPYYGDMRDFEKVYEQLVFCFEGWKKELD